MPTITLSEYAQAYLDALFPMSVWLNEEALRSGFIKRGCNPELVGEVLRDARLTSMALRALIARMGVGSVAAGDVAELQPEFRDRIIFNCAYVQVARPQAKLEWHSELASICRQLQIAEFSFHLAVSIDGTDNERARTRVLFARDPSGEHELVLVPNVRLERSRRFLGLHRSWREVEIWERLR